MNTNEWRLIETDRPPEGVVVETKIDDKDGKRNQCRMRWKKTPRGRLWFFEDYSMYVYYNPTHWRPIL